MIFTREEFAALLSGDGLKGSQLMECYDAMAARIAELEALAERLK